MSQVLWVKFLDFIFEDKWSLTPFIHESKFGLISQFGHYELSSSLKQFWFLDKVIHKTIGKFISITTSFNIFHVQKAELLKSSSHL